MQPALQYSAGSAYKHSDLPLYLSLYQRYKFPDLSPSPLQHHFRSLSPKVHLPAT